MRQATSKLKQNNRPHELAQSRRRGVLPAVGPYYLWEATGDDHSDFHTHGPDGGPGVSGRTQGNK